MYTVCVAVDTLPYPVSPGDYNAVANQMLVFNVGDERVTHTITINQDDECEDDPYENFFFNLALEIGMQPITVIQPHTQVIISDDTEPECSK